MKPSACRWSEIHASSGGGADGGGPGGGGTLARPRFCAAGDGITFEAPFPIAGGRCEALAGRCDVRGGGAGGGASGAGRDARRERRGARVRRTTERANMFASRGPTGSVPAGG